MVSETAASSNDDVNVSNRSASNRKNHGKVPRKIVKAEREKLKRDRMNVLFLELGKVLEPALQNNGKASMLNETMRLLRELITQIDCLRKENDSLLSESHYVTSEKNELKEETSALEAQIEKLQNEIDERVHMQSSWNSSLSVSHPTAQRLPDEHLRLPLPDHASHSAPVMNPVFVVPLHHDPQAYPRPDTEAAPKLSSNVSRPRPRYPSQSDSWPSNILAGQLNVTENAQHSRSISSGTSSG